jgi:hypothetical protein
MSLRLFSEKVSSSDRTLRPVSLRQAPITIPEIVMNLRLRFSCTARFCNPDESKNPREISVKLQYGFFVHIVSLTYSVLSLKVGGDQVAAKSEEVSPGGIKRGWTKPRSRCAASAMGIVSWRSAVGRSSWLKIEWTSGSRLISAPVTFPDGGTAMGL